MAVRRGCVHAGEREDRNRCSSTEGQPAQRRGTPTLDAVRPRLAADQEVNTRTDSGDGSERSAQPVGPLNRLCVLQAVDPRDARGLGHDPTHHRGSAQRHAGRREPTGRSDQNERAPQELKHRHHREHLHDRGVLGVCPDGSCVDRARTQRGGTGQRDRSTPIDTTTGFGVGIGRTGERRSGGHQRFLRLGDRGPSLRHRRRLDRLPFKRLLLVDHLHQPPRRPCGSDTHRRRPFAQVTLGL